jgi:hypothetical protein
MFEKFIKFLLKKNKKTENNLPLNIKKILGKEVTKVKKVVTEDVFEKEIPDTPKMDAKPKRKPRKKNTDEN